MHSQNSKHQKLISRLNTHCLVSSMGSPAERTTATLVDGCIQFIVPPQIESGLFKNGQRLFICTSLFYKHKNPPPFVCGDDYADMGRSYLLCVKVGGFLSGGCANGSSKSVSPFAHRVRFSSKHRFASVVQSPPGFSHNIFAYAYDTTAS